MSLMRIALRTAAVLALKGRTQAGDTVLDSELGTVVDVDGRLLLDSDKKRFIVVYTDDGRTVPEEAKALHEAEKVELKFEYGIAANLTFKERDPDTGEEFDAVAPGIPFTSRSAELYLDLVGFQILKVLRDPDSELSDIFRDFYTSIEKIERRRRGSERTGERVAAQQIVLTLNLEEEPQSLDILDKECGFIRLLNVLDELGGDDQTIAELIRNQLPSGLTDDEKTQELLGLTDAALGALGLHEIQDDSPDLAGAE